MSALFDVGLLWALPAFRHLLQPIQRERVLRAKTVVTRLSPEELQEVENAAERDGKSLAKTRYWFFSNQDELNTILALPLFACSNDLYGRLARKVA
jgi:hypothetical protein